MFHERLLALRKKSAMTQNDLAEKLNVSRQAVSRWEMGTAMPDVENLIAMSELFGVSLDYLLKGIKIEVTQQAEKQEEAQEQQGSWLILPVVLPFLGVSLLMSGWLYEKAVLSKIGLTLLGLSAAGLVVFLLVLAVRFLIKHIKKDS